jgi:hypothetical protein
VPQLLTREARDALHERFLIGVSEEQAHGGGRRFLLAARVIEQQRFDVPAGLADPFGRRRTREQRPVVAVELVAVCAQLVPDAASSLGAA